MSKKNPNSNKKSGGAGFIITLLILSSLSGFSFGGIPLFGFLSGAKKTGQIHKLLRFCLLFLCSLSLVMTALVFLAADPLLRLITPDEGLIATGVPMLRWQVAGSVFAGIVMLATCLSQASGKALSALILSLSRQGVVFVIVLLAASALFGYQGILASQFSADVLSAAVAVIILGKN